MKTSSLPAHSFLSWFATAFLAAAALLMAPSAHAAEQLYTCGMHPQIIKKAPGDCPICGMTLQPVRANTPAALGKTVAAASERKVKYYKSTMTPGEISPVFKKDNMGMDMVPVYEGEDSSGSQAISIAAHTLQQMNLKTAEVGHGPVRRAIRALGTVEFNESGLVDITTKYEGWIEKLFVNTTWTVVKAGDPLFEIYSPDLYNAQLNYIVAHSSETKPGPLTAAARARLSLFDLSEDFINDLATKTEPSRTYVYRAPSDGVVIEKMGVQGQMMKPGERIYRLADLSTVWVQAQVYENDLAFVQTGQSAEVRLGPGGETRVTGKVDLILPQVQASTRTVQARLVVPNPDGKIRPGMFADVRLEAELSPDAVLVPDLAVLRSGERNTVFVALGDGSFEPRTVELGARTADNRYEVRSGVVAGERVVTSGQFLLDSESQLREAIQKMLRNTEDAKATPPADHSGHQTGTPIQTAATVPAAPVPVKALAVALTQAASALGDDNLAVYQRSLPSISAALKAYAEANPHAAHGPLGKFLAGLPEPTDLTAARNAFTGLSTAVANLVIEQGISSAEGLHVFECSMAPQGGKARWIQLDAKKKNPFYGSEMPGCGEEITGPAATPPSASALPPGHPQIDAATMAAFNALRAPAAQASEESCGSCGMSKAAMAAGEPCKM
ncbi:MAG: efflux RND transporter periplasmic adaptor subunit [Opitutaceae bacterium]|jgi:multidrug efflux pump subunit AcrA (membrane-fusion protein)